MKKLSLLIFIPIGIFALSGYAYAQGESSDAKLSDLKDSIRQMQVQQANQNLSTQQNTPTDTVPILASNNFMEKPLLSPQLQNVGFIIVCIIIFVWILGAVMTNYNAGEPEREMKRKRRREQEIQKQVDLAMEQQARIQQRERVKEAQMNAYRELRKEIQAMPVYEHWRQEVFKKFGRKCGMCSSTTDLEIDHRYQPFYSLIKEHGITNIVQAYECSALWDPDIGTPVCKMHHRETSSYKIWEALN